MSRTRRFPFGDAPATPRAGRPTQVVGRDADAAPEPPACAVLARIPHVAVSDEQPARARSGTPRRRLANSPARHRVDRPHARATLPHVSQATANSQLQRADDDNQQTTRRTDSRLLGALPLGIRLAVRSWQLLQPHQAFARFAAMFALVTVGGTSTLLVMNGEGQQAVAPGNPTSATAADQATSVEATPHGPQLDSPPENDADRGVSTRSAVVPTAIGPTGQHLRIPVDGGGSESPKFAEYPTTSYPQPRLPGPARDPLPQVQTTNPPAATARLHGYIEEVSHR